MKVYKHDLFPIPVTYMEGVLGEAHAYAIANYLSCDDGARQHPALQGPALSNHDAHHNTDILTSIDTAIEGLNLRALLQDHINEYAKDIGFRDCSIHASWYNIQNKGSTLKSHMHVGARASSLISGALYINVTDECSPILFSNPNPYSHLFNTDEELMTKYNYTNYQFRPRIGDLILFPSWLLHSSLEPNMMDNRIVISFNVK